MKVITFATPEYEQFIDAAIGAEVIRCPDERPQFWTPQWGALMVKKIGSYLDHLSQPLCVCDADVKALESNGLHNALKKSLGDHDAVFQQQGGGICTGVMLFNPTDRSRNFLTELRNLLRDGHFYSDQKAARDLLCCVPLYYGFIEPHICTHRKGQPTMLLHSAGVPFEEKMEFLQG